MAISPIAIATQGLLDSPLSVAAVRGHLTLEAEVILEESAHSVRITDRISARKNQGIIPRFDDKCIIISSGLKILKFFLIQKLLSHKQLRCFFVI